MSDEFGRFDFGLTPELEARALRLHAESIVIDVLFQGPCGYRSYSEKAVAKLMEEYERHRNAEKAYAAAVKHPIREALRGESDELERCWHESGVTGGNRQASFESHESTAAGFGIAQAQFDQLPWLVKALRADDFRRAKAEGKKAGFLSTQNTVGLDRDLEVLEGVHDMGMRMIGLTYNEMNPVGSGCTERTDAGISNFGAKLIARMNELGIIVDTGHSGHQTTLDACALSTKPVVASHTSAAALYAHERGKEDDEIRAIAATGGVVCVCAVPFFLGPGGNVTVEAILDHIDHIVHTVGWEHVAIGTDWPLQAPKEILAATLMPMAFDMGFREEHALDAVANLVGFDDYRDFPNLTRGLVKRGCTDQQITGILGGNFLRVFEAVCG